MFNAAFFLFRLLHTTCLAIQIIRIPPTPVMHDTSLPKNTASQRHYCLSTFQTNTYQKRFYCCVHIFPKKLPAVAAEPKYVNEHIAFDAPHWATLHLLPRSITRRNGKTDNGYRTVVAFDDAKIRQRNPALLLFLPILTDSNRYSSFSALRHLNTMQRYGKPKVRYGTWLHLEGCNGDDKNNRMPETAWHVVFLGEGTIGFIVRSITHSIRYIRSRGSFRIGWHSGNCRLR